MKIKGFRDWLVVWHGRESVVSLIMSITDNYGGKWSAIPKYLFPHKSD